MKRLLLLVNLVIVTGYLAVGLYPFNFFPRNDVSWTAGEPGIRLGSHSILLSDKTMDLAAGEKAVGFELYLSAADNQDDTARPILTLYDGEIPENLMLAQRRSELLLRAAFLDARGRRRYREVGVRTALHPDVPSVLAVTSGAGGTAVYLDGVMSKMDVNLVLRPENLTGTLLLGNGPGRDHNWRGKLMGIAFFKRSLSPEEVRHHYRIWSGSGGRALVQVPGLTHLYLFDEGKGRLIQDFGPGAIPLNAPEFTEPMRRTLLLPPWRDSIHFEDVAVNILGFVPFGFFFCLYLAAATSGSAWRRAGIALLAAATVSVSIELLQVYLPSRSSSLTDLICNLGGALLGILPACALPAAAFRETPD